MRFEPMLMLLVALFSLTACAHGGIYGGDAGLIVAPGDLGDADSDEELEPGGLLEDQPPAAMPSTPIAPPT
jgi:hypothetical protein